MNVTDPGTEPSATRAEPWSRPAEPPFIKLVQRGRLLAVHVAHPVPGPAFVVPNFGVGPAYMVATHLRPMDADVWRNGRRLGRWASTEGTVNFFDLRQAWRAHLHPPYETVNLHLPLETLAEAAGTTLDELDFEPTAYVSGRTDATMLGLARAMAPAFHRPGELTALFVDRMLLAAATYLVSAHGSRAAAQVMSRPVQGLAPWQQGRVSQMLLDQLDGDVPLSALAEACGLSAGHFSRAFRTSFGLPPHRWLLRERVRRAADLMSNTAQPIHEIAIACGFVDQSHLSRVFRSVMHMPPAAWRRSLLAAPAAGLSRAAG